MFYLNRIKQQLPSGRKFFNLALAFICLFLLFPHMAEAATKQNPKPVLTAEQEPVYQKLAQWLYFQQDKLPQKSHKIIDFINNNPDWPKQQTLRQVAEDHLPQNMSDDDIIRWFRKNAPQNAEGLDRYLSALKRQNKLKEMRQALAKYWPNINLSTNGTKKLLQNYRNFVTVKTHRARIEYLLSRDYASQSQLILPYIDKDHQKLYTARIKLIKNSRGLDQAIANVPPHMKNDAGLIFNRLQWRRKHKKNDRAEEILLGAKPQNMGKQKKWWRERHILVRRAMERKDYKRAYQLAHKHWQTEGFSQVQAEWVSGFLALEFVNKPKEALQHFKNLQNNVTRPISLARAFYWQGRSHDVLGNAKKATQSYQSAAQYMPTYYGQIAFQKLKNNSYRPLMTTPKVSLKSRKNFNQNEMVNAIRILKLMGQADKTDVFFAKLMAKTDKPMEYVLLAELGQETKQYHHTVRSSKNLYYDHEILMMHYAYPNLEKMLPDHAPEAGLVHAIIRQESHFNIAAKSPAGARGLMQLMPATAGDMARKLNKGMSKKKLTEDARYNIALGSAYLNYLLDYYDGSYILTIAAYNAGPGRVNGWIKTFGDPRDKNIDQINWVEQIPIYETRNYVQRILEGLFMYHIIFDKQPKTLTAYK